jgi:hypothetical protein
LIQWQTRTQRGWMIGPADVMVMVSAVIAALPLSLFR